MNKFLRDRLMDRRRDRRDERQGVKGTGPYGMGGRDYGYDRRDDGYDRNDYDRCRDRESDERGYDRNYDHRDRRFDDYDRGQDFEYNDHHMRRLELTDKDIMEWGRDMKNCDGTHGAKFTKDQIIPMAKQMGVKFDKFTEDEFAIAVDAMYADYCEALQEMGVSNYSKPEPYIHLAKHFLMDKDFMGEPYEKLAAYYYAIVEYDK